MTVSKFLSYTSLLFAIITLTVAPIRWMQGHWGLMVWDWVLAFVFFIMYNKLKKE